MIRPVLTEALLFLTPFVLYAVFLWATKSGVLDLKSWPVVRDRDEVFFRLRYTW